VSSCTIGSILERMPRSVLCSILGVYLGAYLRVSVKQIGSVPSRAIGNIWSCRLGVCHPVQLGVYSQAGWECAIKFNQECTLECTWADAINSIWLLAFRFVVCSVLYRM